MLLRHLLRKAGLARSGTALRFRCQGHLPSSCFGTSSLTLGQLGVRARGAVVIDNLVTAAELDDMAAVGVWGRAAQSPKGTLNTIAERLRGCDWHIQSDTHLSVITALKDDIAVFPFPMVFNHFGRARAAVGPNQPGFGDLIDLMKSGRTHVKISAPYRTSDKSPDFPTWRHSRGGLLQPMRMGCCGGATGHIRVAIRRRARSLRPIQMTVAAC